MISMEALKEEVEGKQAEAIIVQVLDIRELPGEEKKWRLNIPDGDLKEVVERRQRSPSRQRR